MKKALVLVIITFFGINARATHIACGTLSYKYLGTFNNGVTVRYQLIAKLYRDCSISTNATLDPEIDVGVYTNKQLFTTCGMSLSMSKTLFGDACYEEGVYSGTVDLDSGKEYTFVYARCCLTQFANAEYDQGFSLYSYMQNTNNKSSSPYLKQPAINYVKSYKGKQNYDLHAIDDDNDTLRYKIVEPLLGGDKNTTKPSLSSSIDNMFPPYSNSYSNFRFINGYSILSPFGSFAKLSFDSVSGIAIIDSPLFTHSKFYWCIKISEYRNNVLVGITYMPVCTHFNAKFGTDIKNGIGDDFTISPNPFTDGITITGLTKSIAKIGVYDITGKQLDLISVSNANQVTYSSNNPGGLYLLRFMDEKGNVVGTQKIVKR